MTSEVGQEIPGRASNDGVVQNVPIEATLNQDGFCLFPIRRTGVLKPRRYPMAWLYHVLDLNSSRLSRASVYTTCNDIMIRCRCFIRRRF
jgi:hypothetical protein